MLTCGKLNKQLRFSLPSIHSPFAPTRLLQRSEKEPRPLKSSVIFFRSCSGRRKREDVKKFLILVVLGFALYGLYERNPDFFPSFAEQSTTSDQLLKSVYEKSQSNLQVGGSGIVMKILPDDLQGSRDLRFILRLPSGQTILISHNIDLAHRVNSLRAGDTVEFFGQ